MFFFQVRPISILWETFLHDVGYGMDWRPGGRFYRVNPDRYFRLPGGNPDAYLRHILEKHP